MPEEVQLEPGAGVRVEWDLDALMRTADAADPAGGPAWSAEADWAALHSLRVISCATGEEAVAIVVARPSGAQHHDADLLAGVRVGPLGVEEADEVLLSTEYDAEGNVRRLGAELWLTGGSATRVAADSSGSPARAPLGEAVRETTPMDFRLAGAQGSGLHELIRPAG